MPGGDTISRKGIVDAILLGCIPVLFHTGQLAQWPWHWGPWVHTATVMIVRAEPRLECTLALSLWRRALSALGSNLPGLKSRVTDRISRRCVLGA